MTAYMRLGRKVNARMKEAVDSGCPDTRNAVETIAGIMAACDRPSRHTSRAPSGGSTTQATGNCGSTRWTRTIATGNAHTARIK